MAQSITSAPPSTQGQARETKHLDHSAGLSANVQEAAGTAWGWFPAITVLCALGILMVVTAYTQARFTEVSWITPMYWGGLLMMVAPVTLRLALPSASRRERIGLILALMIGIFLFKMLLSPNMFYLSDEFTHYRTTDEILLTGELFNLNPSLPTSSFYPGLQNATVAVVSISGLSIFHAGTLIVFMAQLVLVMAVFLLFELLSRSAWIAGLATLIYMANPNYIFYGQQFGYESLSLPIAALVLYLIALRAHKSDSQRWWLNLMIIPMMLAIIPTHHMTSYALIAFLSLWTIVSTLERRNFLIIGDRLIGMVEAIITWIGNRGGIFRWLLNQVSLLELNSDHYKQERVQRYPALWWLTALATILTVGWLFSMASLTIGYLSPVLTGAVQELLQFIAGESGPKETFKSYNELVPPIWERYIAFGAVGLILGGLTLGWLHTWRRYRRTIPAIVLMIASLAYPVTLAMRLTEKGAETSNRSSEFLFIAIGFVLAVAIVDLFLRRGATRLRVGIVTAYITLIFMGGVITGQAWWARLPGDYVVGGDTRSIQPESVAAGEWAQNGLGYNSVIIADSLNYKTMTAFGEQFMVRGASWVVFSHKLGEEEAYALGEKEVDFIVTDWRTTQYLPLNGHYFESNEPNADRHTEPFPQESVMKFDDHPQISRVFDSGNIRIFDVQAFRQMPPPTEQD